jgi:hypothetical protein
VEAVGNTHFTTVRLQPQAGCCEKRAHHFIKVVLRRSKGKYRTPQHHARTCVYMGGRVPLAATAVSKTDTLRAPNTKSGWSRKRGAVYFMFMESLEQN